MFMVTYPMLTTDPKYKPKNNLTETYDNLGDIEYPSLSDIKMKKDSPLNDVTNRLRPSVDRSSKLAAEKAYKEKCKSVSELIKEKEQLIDKALEKEKEALKLEVDLEKTFREEPTVDESKRREWYEKQTELKYKIMQYDNERDDNVSAILVVFVKSIHYQFCIASIAECRGYSYLMFLCYVFMECSFISSGYDDCVYIHLKYHSFI